MSGLYIITGHPRSGKTDQFIKARADVIKKKTDVVFIQSPFDSMCLFQKDERTYDRLLEMIFWYRDQLIIHDGKKILIDDHPKLMLDTIYRLKTDGYITQEQELNLDLLINDDIAFDVWGAKIFMLPWGVNIFSDLLYTTSIYDAVVDISNKMLKTKIPNTITIRLKNSKVIKI